MKSLYINTTGNKLSLAFKNGDKFNVFESDGQKSQTEEIFTQIKAILNGVLVKDLDLVVCLGGPGSFTGIRLGLSVVKGFNIAVSVPVVVIDNFMATVYSMDESILPDRFQILIPAGVNDVYSAIMGRDSVEVEPPKIIKKDLVSREIETFSDVALNPQRILERVEASIDLKNFVQPAIEPTYVKPHYAKVKCAK